MYSSLEDEVSQVIELLWKLKREGIKNQEIVLISSYSIDNPRCCLNHGKLPNGIGKLKTEGFMWQAKKDELRFSTISSFKGLEAKMVILMDIDAFLDD
ncbi:MAG: hypothetical protein GX677_01255 [Treponema sp.]|nr:hypothetical protein [Treponema sp.]